MQWSYDVAGLQLKLHGRCHILHAVKIVVTSPQYLDALESNRDRLGVRVDKHVD